MIGQKRFWAVVPVKGTQLRMTDAVMGFIKPAEQSLFRDQGTFHVANRL